MASLNKQQSVQIKKLLQSDEWSTLEAVLSAWIVEKQAEGITGNTPFETLRALHKQQGAVEGIKQFIDALETNALS